MGYIPTKLIIHFNEHDPKRRCYVTDAENKKIQESAQKWAENQWNWNPSKLTKGEYEKLDTGHSTLNLDNTHFTGVFLIDLEVRSQGGRAYKVCVTELNNMTVDLREDQLMETIMNYGIEAGGRLLGEFTFGVSDSGMKLYLVGSEAHTELLIATKEKNQKKITNLIPGHKYRSRSKEATYMGKFGKFHVFLRYMYHDGSLGYHGLEFMKSKGSAWVEDLGFEMEPITQDQIIEAIDKEIAYVEGNLVKWGRHYGSRERYTKEKEKAERIRKLVLDKK